MDKQDIFLSGFAPFHDLFFCAKAKAGTGEVIPSGTFPFRVFMLSRNQWSPYDRVFNWAPIAITSVKPEDGLRAVVAIGAHGECYEMRPANGDEQTGVLPGPSRFLARNVAVVGDVIYAVGMGRAMARRDGPMAWTRIDPAVPVSNSNRAVGFNDLAAFSPDEMYTVGWGGEILRGDGERWQAVDSPVSTALVAACTGADGLLYAVGYNGTMVRGRGDEWSVIETGSRSALRDVCTYGDDILVATPFDVLRLGPDGLQPIEEFEDPEDVPGSCNGLCAAADGSGVFWLGNSGLFFLTGTTWKRVV